MRPPIDMAATICASKSLAGAMLPMVAAIPPDTPMIPNAFPVLAVDCFDKPPNAPTQHRPEAKYII